MLVKMEHLAQKVKIGKSKCNCLEEEEVDERKGDGEEDEGHNLSGRSI